MVYKVHKSASAEQDMFAILDYLTENLSSPSAARRFYYSLLACYERLRLNPFIYQLCRDEELSARGFRCAPVMRYLVFYTTDEKRKFVKVHRIIHGTMDYSKMDFPSSPL